MKLLVKIWLNYPNFFKPICWVKGHNWYEIVSPGKPSQWLYNHICLGCGDAKMNYTDEFKKFWKGFPSRWSSSRHCYIKRRKSPAFKAWQKLPQDIRDKCLRIVKKIKNAEGGAVRDCVTWLNQEGWDDIDEPEDVQHLPAEMTNVLKTVPGGVNPNNERNRQIEGLGKK